MQSAVAEIQRLLNGDALTKSDTINLMSQLRLCLEADNLKKVFPYLTMYCDWAVHPQLSRSAPAFVVIESIADALIVHPKAPESPGFFDDITKAFLFDEFRADCIKVSQYYGTPDEFCTNSEIWNAFLTLLMSILLDRPLAFPEKRNMSRKVQIIYNRIQRKWTRVFKNTLGIKKVSFILGRGDQQGRVLWKLELIPGQKCIPKSVELHGPLRRPQQT